MIKREEILAMKAIALCFKPFLKPEEARIYLNLGSTQMAKVLDNCGIYKNNAGYYKREELDKYMSGQATPMHEREVTDADFRALKKKLKC